MWRKLRSCTTLTLTGYHPLRTARPPTYAPTAVPATQPLQHYASGRAAAHTGLTLYYPAHKPRRTVKSECTDCISSRRLAAPLLQSLPGCLSVAVPHSESHGYSPQHASTPFGFGGAATDSPTLKSRYATPSTLHSRALRFHRASPSPRLKPRER